MTPAKAEVVPVKPFKPHTLAAVEIGGQRFIWIGANLIQVFAEFKGR